MKECARAALRKAAMIIVLAGMAVLPGCAVVGPLLSVGGMAGLAPLQYASTLYTVGEFGYEYAANDNDPGEVIRAKIDGVMSGEAFAVPGSDPAASAGLSRGYDARQGFDARDGYDVRPAYGAPSPLPDAMFARATRLRPAAAAPVAYVAKRAGQDAPSLSAEARQRRIEQLLGERTARFERLETRRLAFRQARRDQLTLRHTAMVAPPNLFRGAVGETTLRR
jgi:hypothetical protein